MYGSCAEQFRAIPPEELPPGAVCGVAFTTVSLNPQIYLPWLYAELKARGVHFIRRKLDSIGEAAEVAGPGGVVVNATALGTKKDSSENVIVLTSTVQERGP